MTTGDYGEFVPCGRARRKERHAAHRWMFQAEDDSPAQAEATCPGYGEIVALPAALRREVEDYIERADALRAAGDAAWEVAELRAIKRWVEHALRLADSGRKGTDK